MTIRTKEAEAPSHFPPARLFLDDIEEIVRILIEAAKKQIEQQRRPDEVDKPKVTLTINDQVCDEVQELPRIAKKTINLLVRVETQKWSVTALTFTRFSSFLDFYAFTRDEKLSIYHDLVPIFKRRNLWLATVVRAHRTLTVALFTLLTLIGLALDFTPKTHTPLMLAIAPSLLATTLAITFLAATWHHSIIILHHSSERDDLRQDLLRKTLPVAIGCVLTFLLTLLGMYLKHKYWP